MALAILPFLLTGVAETLGAEPQTGCGQVVLIVVGVPLGLMMWLMGLLAADANRRGTSNGSGSDREQHRNDGDTPDA